MTTDLSKLTAAAAKWEEMAGRFKVLEGMYEREVHGITLDRSWEGLSAQAANEKFTVTLKEFQGAQKEAKAVAGILRDAHTQLVDLRGRVEAARDDAVKAGMRVSDQGVVSFDTERLSQAERTAYVHDGNYQEDARALAAEWSAHIRQAVQSVTVADDGLRVMLEAAVRDSDRLDGTLNGFNREAGASPYPSLEAAGRAANMPEDRKQVPEWWRSLDPVTRGVLLQERGDELRAAGIMDPTLKWRSPDEGSGAFGVEKPTPRDVWLHAQALGIATAGDVAGQVGASRNMLHYLDGTGDPLNLDVDRILHDDETFRSQVEELHLGHNQESWHRNALDEFHKAGGDKTVVMPVESDKLDRTFREGEWFHAVGSHSQNVSGLVCVSPGEDGKPKVSLEYQVNVWDRYNWDVGKSTELPGGLDIRDEDMGRLHKTGIAQEFDMRGSSSFYAYDLNASAPPALAPQEPGREGTQADVSRGEEKNR
ncbi:hypothetical protein [Streptomyces amakusaensis]|uniref:WXG100 family type VII secretion target n=1 Tax=Streptomyces amakusaensis TaxID=67271 RepID=A0ABW0AHE2_9ACTN